MRPTSVARNGGGTHVGGWGHRGSAQPRSARSLAAMALDPAITELATGRNFAALTTLMPDGQPQTQVMWVDADDRHVLINTEVDRQKHRNVQRDPRVTVTVMDSENPYHYIEVRGRVVEEIRGPEARAHIDACSQRYNGQPYPAEAIGTERVILRIEPSKVHVNG